MRFWALIFLYFPGTSPVRAEISSALKSSDTVSHCTTGDPKAGYVFKAGCRETINRAGRVSQMAYNQQGLRDHDYPPFPKKGWKRLLFLGPSSLAGPGIAAEATPPKRLEQVLREKNAKLEVINGGVEGYMALAPAAKFDDWLNAYHPDYSLFYLTFATAVPTEILFAPYFHLPADSGPVLQMSLSPGFERLLRLFHMMPTNPVGWQKAYSMQSFAYRAQQAIRCRFKAKSGVEQTRCLLEPVFKALAYMNSTAKKHGTKFLLVYQRGGQFGNDMHLSPMFDVGVAQAWDRFTPSLTIQVSDIEKVLEEDGIPTLGFYPRPFATLPGDYHFNEQGADEFAHMIGAELSDFLRN